MSKGDVVCKNAKVCPIALAKMEAVKGKKKIVSEHCGHEAPHILEPGCKIVICGHLRNEDCGCIPVEEEKKVSYV